MQKPRRSLLFSGDSDADDAFAKGVHEACVGMGYVGLEIVKVQGGFVRSRRDGRVVGTVQRARCYSRMLNICAPLLILWLNGDGLEPSPADGSSGSGQFVEHEAGHCRAGRLVAWYRESGKPFEPKFEPSPGLIEDTARRVSGPIRVWGGIPVIAADGTTQEVRNRSTLCRGGRSDNKPYCDGSHAA
jgi:hypothetical protein